MIASQDDRWRAPVANEEPLIGDPLDPSVEGAIAGQLVFALADFKEVFRPWNRALAITASLAVGAGLLWAARATQGADNGIAWVVASWLVTAGFVFLLRRSLVRAVRRDLTGSTWSALFRLDQVSFQTRDAVSTQRWNAFASWQERPTCFLLRYRNRLMIVVPKRAFSPADVDRLRKLLVQSLTERNGARG